MRCILTLIIFGCISFTGYSVFAQSTGSDALESIRQSLSGGEGEGGEGTSLADRMDEMLGSTGETTAPTPVEQAPIIELPVISEVVEVPEINVANAEATDSRGRYRPRLKVIFAEFPLRSLTTLNQTDDGIPVKGAIPLDAIVRRIKDRFSISQFHLTVKDRKVIVSGTADTEHQRNLITVMLRFEPGIDLVQNEMIVSPAP